MPQDQKKLPWFKFTPNEWLTGNIVGEDMCAQGLFINICAYYWKEGGNVALEKIKRRYGKYEQLELLLEEYLTVSKDGIVHISFLDDQLEEMGKEKEKDRENGKKGAEVRWAGHRGATDGQWPNMADKDIELDKEKEKEYNIPKDDFLKNQKKKVKIDPRVGKSLKKLNSAGGIDLAEVEERLFPGQGTQTVIEEFQIHFAEIGYTWKSDQGVKTVFLSWINQQKLIAVGEDLDKNIIPSTKLNNEAETEYAKFEEMKASVSFLSNFLCQESPLDRKAYQRDLIAKYGLKGTVRLIATYWAKSPGGQGRNTWKNYSSLIDQLKLTEDEWIEIKNGHEINL